MNDILPRDLMNIIYEYNDAGFDEVIEELDSFMLFSKFTDIPLGFLVKLPKCVLHSVLQLKIRLPYYCKTCETLII